MKLYKFSPNDNITTKELAELTSRIIVATVQALQGQLVTGDDTLEVEESFYLHLPENLKRHFR